MGLVSVVILALSSLCVNTTLMAIVSERTREFALQSLGRQQRRYYPPDPTGNEHHRAGSGGEWLGARLSAGAAIGVDGFNYAISLRLPVLPITLLLSLLVAVLAAIVPVRRAVSVEPAKVLKGE